MWSPLHVVYLPSSHLAHLGALPQLREQNIISLPDGRISDFSDDLMVSVYCRDKFFDWIEGVPIIEARDSWTPKNYREPFFPRNVDPDEAARRFLMPSILANRDQIIDPLFVNQHRGEN